MPKNQNTTQNTNQQQQLIQSFCSVCLVNSSKNIHCMHYIVIESLVFQSYTHAQTHTQYVHVCISPIVNIQFIVILFYRSIFRSVSLSENMKYFSIRIVHHEHIAQHQHQNKIG